MFPHASSHSRVGSTSAISTYASPSSWYMMRLVPSSTGLRLFRRLCVPKSSSRHVAVRGTATCPFVHQSLRASRCWLRHGHHSHTLTLLLHVLRIRPDTCCGGCCVLFKCGGPGARAVYIPMIIRDPNTMEPLPSKFGKPKPHASESSQTTQPPTMSHPLTPKRPMSPPESLNAPRDGNGGK
jgi:hypothetical protein